ncbi:MAG: hypothetical protein K2W95_15675 [Candidatus Obscuribacterales bacterium]|nr:hypothetical protein [Candidatus Obscuribacterales bacterium]
MAIPKDKPGAVEWRIANRIPYPQWAKADERYRRLDMHDRFLDGSFYDHLPNTFWEEVDHMGRYIPIADRAPSIRFNIPAMLSEQVARKLFAGRHAPSIVHDDSEIVKRVQALAEECQLDQFMMQATTWGSVGSSAITFKVLKEGEKTKLVASVWQAKVCRPRFDKFGELSQLRVNYPVEGVFFIENGKKYDVNKELIKEDQQYWFVRDFTTEREVTYVPIKVGGKDPWNPLKVESPKLVEDPDETVSHGLGFVPGHWFINLSLGTYPDGACKWTRALPTMIDMDYRLSQLGMGVGYNSSPQIVIKGKLMNMEDSSGGTIVRGPTRYLQLAPDLKDSDGFGETGNDVKLLEMSGTGIDVGLKYLEACKKVVLAQLSASQKDPNKVTTAMSGKGMELLDEEYIDQVHEFRTSYCSNGLLKVLKKIALTCNAAGHPLAKKIDAGNSDGLTLGYPHMHDIGPSEFAQLIQGLSLAIESQIMDVLQARDLLRAQVDLPVISANRDGAKVEPPKNDGPPPSKSSEEG